MEKALARGAGVTCVADEERGRLLREVEGDSPPFEAGNVNRLWVRACDRFFPFSDISGGGENGVVIVLKDDVGEGGEFDEEMKSGARDCGSSGVIVMGTTPCPAVTTSTFDSSTLFSLRKYDVALVEAEPTDEAVVVSSPVED